MTVLQLESIVREGIKKNMGHHLELTHADHSEISKDAKAIFHKIVHDEDPKCYPNEEKEKYIKIFLKKSQERNTRKNEFLRKFFLVKNYVKIHSR